MRGRLEWLGALNGITAPTAAPRTLQTSARAVAAPSSCLLPAIVMIAMLSRQH
jgi:hypothetical protein